MHYHIGNVFLMVVQNVQVVIFQFQNHIIKIIMLVQQYVFMHINKFHGVLCMEDAFSEKNQLFEDSYHSMVTARMYTRKVIFMMETSIVDFRQLFYIPVI